MRKVLNLIAVVLLAAAGQTAQAALSSSAPPTCTFADLTVAASDCSGAWLGNTSNQQADVLAQILADFGVNLSLAGKSDDPGFGPFTSNPEVTSGTLTFDIPQSGPFVIALKAANEFSLYFYDGTHTSIASLDFVTNGTALNSQGRPQALSHADLYVTPIPEPEIYAMLAAGLGLMGFVAKRRRQTHAAAA